MTHSRITYLFFTVLKQIMEEFAATLGAFIKRLEDIRDVVHTSRFLSFTIRKKFIACEPVFRHRNGLLDMVKLLPGRKFTVSVVVDPGCALSVSPWHSLPPSPTF